MQKSSAPHKILVIRFSSIGDIVLTTPVVRCIRKAHPEAEIHFLTKKSFAFLPAVNPHITKVWVWEEVQARLDILKQEQFDWIVDLHKNLRSLSVKNKLNAKVLSFSKENIGKWLLVNAKLDILPQKHLVERYFKGLKKGGVKYDGHGLDFSLPDGTKLPMLAPPNFVAVVLGAAHATKQIPEEKLLEIIPKINRQVVLLGGKDERSKAQAFAKKCAVPVINWAGEIDFFQSSLAIKKADAVITSDTGLMHVAAAFQRPTAVLWGNTVPKLGMYPFENPHHQNFEVSNLSCRPCSKIGKKKCPKGHFNCMLQQDANLIAAFINKA